MVFGQTIEALISKFYTFCEKMSASNFSEATSNLSFLFFISLWIGPKISNVYYVFNRIEKYLLCKSIETSMLKNPSHIIQKII